MPADDEQALHSNFKSALSCRFGPPGDGCDEPIDSPLKQDGSSFRLFGSFVGEAIENIDLAIEVAKFTESPIETMLAVAILRAWPDTELRLPGEAWAPEWTLIPQYPWRNYRVDLALRKPNGRIIFIECDGREFHSTSEQIARDYHREDEMTQAGFTVVRFSGSEINHSTAACLSLLSSRFRRWGQ